MNHVAEPSPEKSVVSGPETSSLQFENPAVEVEALNLFYAKQQALFDVDMKIPDKDVTAIGTMNIARNGAVEGKFDLTVQDFAAIPGLVYTGSVTINPDCTGTIVFVTSAGTERTDSIVVVNRREMLGMTQDPLNLWTYQVRRIARGGGHDDDDD